MPEIPMLMNKIMEMLEKHAVPALVILIGMYFSIDGLKRDVGEMKESIKLLANQQIEIARINENIKSHRWRLDNHEAKIKVLESRK